MISIRRYLNGSPRASEEDDPRESASLNPVVQLLIDGIESYTLEGAAEDRERLQAGTRQVISSLESGAPPEQVYELAALAVDALREHNERVQEHSKLRIAELEAKVRLLAEAIAAVGSSSGESIRRLQEIKGQLLGNIDVRDIRSMKARLGQYLDSVLAEAERQRAETERAAQQLNRARLRESAASSADETVATDAATGLPSRAAAEQVIAHCCEDGTTAFIVIMVINQVDTLNQSLGSRFVDLVLQRFAGFLRERLPAVDQLFRWSGPTVVALIRRRTALEVRSVIEPVLLQRLTLKSVNPDVQVPISAHWTVLPLMASPRVLFHKMDGFAGIEHIPE